MNENTDNQTDCRLDTCLFFATTKLSRVFNKIAEETFSMTGLSPSHAFILYIVNKAGQIHQKEVGERLLLTPSTVTRFVEKLERKGFVTKQVEGKNVYLFKTSQGEAMQTHIVKAWEDLHEIYADILSSKEAQSYIASSGKLLKALEEKGYQ